MTGSHAGQSKLSVFFIQRSLAASADIYTLHMSVDIQLHLMDVSAERSYGVSVRVADVFTCGPAFAAQCAYLAHSLLSLRFRFTVILYHCGERNASVLSIFLNIIKNF